MKKLILLLALTLSSTAYSQDVLTVNNKNINEYEYIDVYTAIKPLSTKECIFIDTGDNDFKKKNYDATKNQRIYWNEKKLKSGNVMKVKKYLLLNGWSKIDGSETSQGDVQISINTYIKDKE
jgi:hypothetical protein